MDSVAEVKKSPTMLEHYRENLRNVFDHYFKRIDLGQKREGEKRKILSVGCGFGYEAEPVLRIISNSQYIGIDIDEDYISSARAANRDVPDVTFETKDAQKEDAFIDKDFWDIILIRHPQVIPPFLSKNSRSDWKKIFANSINALREKGVLFISTATPQERNAIISFLKENNETIDTVIDEVNKEYKSDPYINFDDHHIIMVQKKEKK